MKTLVRLVVLAAFLGSSLAVEECKCEDGSYPLNFEDIDRWQNENDPKGAHSDPPAVQCGSSTPDKNCPGSQDTQVNTGDVDVIFKEKCFHYERKDGQPLAGTDVAHIPNVNQCDPVCSDYIARESAKGHQSGAQCQFNEKSIISDGDYNKIVGDCICNPTNALEVVGFFAEIFLSALPALGEIVNDVWQTAFELLVTLPLGAIPGLGEGVEAAVVGTITAAKLCDYAYDAATGAKAFVSWAKGAGKLGDDIGNTFIKSVSRGDQGFKPPEGLVKGGGKDGDKGAPPDWDKLPDGSNAIGKEPSKPPSGDKPPDGDKPPEDKPPNDKPPKCDKTKEKCNDPCEKNKDDPECNKNKSKKPDKSTDRPGKSTDRPDKSTRDPHTSTDRSDKSTDNSRTSTDGPDKSTRKSHTTTAKATTSQSTTLGTSTTKTSSSSASSTASGQGCSQSCAACNGAAKPKPQSGNGKREVQQEMNFKHRQQRGLSKRALLPSPSDYGGSADRFMVNEYHNANTKKLVIDGTIAIPSTAMTQWLNNATYQGAVGGLYGCTSVVVASQAGVWLSHFWEVPSFRKTVDKVGQTADQQDKNQFTSQVLNQMHHGTSAGMPGLAPLTAQGQAFHSDEKPVWAIITPKGSTGLKYQTEINGIKRQLDGLFPGKPPVIIDYQANSDDADQLLSSTGKILFQYDPVSDQPTDQSGNKTQKAQFRLWVEDRPNYAWQKYWIAEGKQKVDDPNNVPVAADRPLTGPR